MVKECSDALGAANIALEYLAKKGKIVFSHEIESIFRKSNVWFVEIDSDYFTGFIVIKPETETIREVPL